MAGGSMGNTVSQCVQANLRRLRFPQESIRTLRFNMTFRPGN